MKIEFTPDWTTPPGSSIQDLLDEKGLSRDHLGQALGLSQEEVLDLIYEKICSVRISRDLVRELRSSEVSTSSWRRTTSLGTS